jgi:Luciferase-like monooxygenase
MPSEQWGYKCYWVAEHHSIQGLACSATPVLIGHIAGATKTIRVGSGGVMLPNHAPLVVAEQAGHWELGLKAIPIHTSFLVEPSTPLGIRWESRAPVAKPSERRSINNHF